MHCPVDDIVLGETGIDVAKSSYANRPYVMSNLMNDEKEDTVYTCFGMNETPIPEGYEKNEFGFLFAELVNGGGIYQIVIRDSSFTCIGGLCVGDSGDVALEYFGLQEIVFLEDTDLEWILDNGAALSYHKDNEEEYFISYEMDKNRVTVKVVDGVIHYISLLRESDLYE